MHCRNGPLHGSQNVAVEEPIEIPRQSALNANFGCALFPGLVRLARDILGGERVGIRRAGPSAKAAEAAADKTDIRKVDVAIYDVGDGLTYGFAPQRIGDSYQGFQLRALGGCEP